jgi:hypothetical protein
MGGVDDWHGHRLRPEANQVAQESSVEDKSLFGSEESPRIPGALTFLGEQDVLILRIQYKGRWCGRCLAVVQNALTMSRCLVPGSLSL